MKALTLFLALFVGVISCANKSLETPVVSQSEINSQALDYVNVNEFNSGFYVLIDMRIHSGKNRFFVIDLKTNEVLMKGLCSHGCCKKEWGSDESKADPVFSNVSGSHCSSLGKYKIGARGWSNWGINVNYKLHGLETTNSNAYDRDIVLHSWESVPDIELYPNGTPEGWGCPAVSNNLMRKVDAKLKEADKPVLMWVYK
ncbi:MAG: murein L,D-transpeptidase catalytic domain family protein [Bacteroidia bacterium]